MAITNTEPYEHLREDSLGDTYQTYITDEGLLGIIPEDSNEVVLGRASATELRDLLNKYIEEAE